MLNNIIQRKIVLHTDVCYTKNDAYSIVPHDEKSLEAGEITSDDKEANRVIYEEVSK